MKLETNTSDIRWWFWSVTLAFIMMTQIISAQQSVDPEYEDSISPGSVPLPSELERVLRDYEQGWREHNADALAELFSPDGYILRPGHPPVQGREAIADAYHNSGGPLHLRAYSFALADPVAYIIGGYRNAASGPDTGKFILTLRLMQDGKWYITADMDNSNQ